MDYMLFLLICVAATFSPGPAVLLAIKNSVTYGTTKVISGILGNVMAMLTLASLSAAGLGAVILASAFLFTAIKFVGGAYLIYLGVKAWSSHGKVKLSPSGLEHLQTKSRRKLFIEAYFVGISNPKAIAFYTALFPQFIDLNAPVLPQFIMLSLTFACFSFSALFIYALAARSMIAHLAKEKVNRAFNKITGSIFVLFGMTLMLSHKA